MTNPSIPWLDTLTSVTEGENRGVHLRGQHGLSALRFVQRVQEVEALVAPRQRSRRLATLGKTTGSAPARVRVTTPQAPTMVTFRPR